MHNNEIHESREAHKITGELRHHDFADARKELSMEAHHPLAFKKIIDKMNQDLKADHQHPLSVEHDKHGNISHLHFGGQDIYDKVHHTGHPTGHHKGHGHLSHAEQMADHKRHQEEERRHEAQERARHEHKALKPHAKPGEAPAAANPDIPGKDNYSGYLDSSNASRGTESPPAAPPVADLQPETIEAIRKIRGSGEPTPRGFYMIAGDPG